MDPECCLQLAMIFIWEGRKHEARRTLHYYRDWLRNGGFPAAHGHERYMAMRRRVIAMFRGSLPSKPTVRRPDVWAERAAKWARNVAALRA